MHIVANNEAMRDVDSSQTPDESELRQVFIRQQSAFADEPSPTVPERRAALRSLKKQLLNHQDELASAVAVDFGTRSIAETKLLEVLGAVMAINHAIRCVGRWQRNRKRSVELLFLSNSLTVQYQPKGVVGIIVPWNFPIYLAIGPLVAAIAAGNRVMLKMSELTPETNSVMRRLISGAFSKDSVFVAGDEITDPTVFTGLPFNHLVFTGSTRVGRIVMTAAAQHLTPVTLELGGKSPAIVLPDADLENAARCIAHGKSTNAGQVCVSPDYALVPRENLDEFARLVQKTKNIQSMGESDRGQHTSVIKGHHTERLRRLLDDAVQNGARLWPCGTVGKSKEPSLFLVTETTNEMQLMREEIFGPVLPVLPYDSVEEAISYVSSRDRPLALYCFGRSSTGIKSVLDRTHSGGVTINDWGWHVLNHDAPFGGVGGSGMGSYHGVEGFRELSHARTVFKRRSWFPIGLFHPPYGNFVQRLVGKLWLSTNKIM